MDAAEDEIVNGWCDVIREGTLDLHGWLSSGQRENVYENGLLHRLRRRGLEASQQYPIKVRDRDGTLLGDFYADLSANGNLIIELKAARAISDEHIAQLLGYLKATGKRHGLLINFGAPALQIRKFVI